MRGVLGIFVFIVALGGVGAIYHYNFTPVLHEAEQNTQQLAYYAVGILALARYLLFEYEHFRRRFREQRNGRKNSRATEKS